MGFPDDKPVILVVGGSTGAVRVNEAVRKILPELLKEFRVVHLCGKGKTDSAYNGTDGYVQIEYCDREMKDLFAAADIVISRAGANAICELLALRKPNLLIPLSKEASRGDQILNAESFEKQGFSMVMQEEDITEESLLTAVKELYAKRNSFIDTMMRSHAADATEVIVKLLCELSGE